MKATLKLHKRASACGARKNHQAYAFLDFFDRGDIIASLYLALRALGTSANCATPRLFNSRPIFYHERASIVNEKNTFLEIFYIFC